MRSGYHFKYINCKHNLEIDILSIQVNITPKQVTDDLFDMSTLVQIMHWCHQATNHYMNQQWLKSAMPYGVLGHNELPTRSCRKSHSLTKPGNCGLETICFLMTSNQLPWSAPVSLYQDEWVIWLWLTEGNLLWYLYLLELSVTAYHNPIKYYLVL